MRTRSLREDCYFRLQPKPAELAARLVVGIFGRG
jgi:hypothetical protein